MTIFRAKDQLTIAKYLNLDRSQYQSSCTLKSLMDDLVRFDTSNSTDLVGEIIAGLDRIETIDGEIEASSGNIGISSYSIEGEVSVSYSNSAAVSSGNKQSKQKQIDQIRGWLDPDNLLESFSLSGRVINTL